MIGQIENAMMARLKAAADAGVLGYAYRTLDSLPIDADARLREVVIQFPAAWTVFAGWRPVQTLGDGSSDVLATFHLIVGAHNARNERATRMGGSDKEVGSYQMAEDAAYLLNGQSLGLSIGGLVLGATTPLYSGALKDGRMASLISVTFTTKFNVAGGAFPTGNPGQFKTWHADWDVPPFGDLAVTLPDDGQADASDTLTLPDPSEAQ